MEPLKRLDQTLREMSLPELEEVDRFSADSPHGLVLCAGFEDRSLVSLEDLAPILRENLRVLLVEYEPRLFDNRLTEAIALCENHRCDLVRITYERSNRAGAGEQVASWAEGFSEKVLVDVSGMSRLLATQVLVALWRRRHRLAEAEVLYVEAENYPPDEVTVEKELVNQGEQEINRALMFISSGVYDLAVVPELSSVALQGMPTCCVFFPSFNPYQLAAIRSEIQPASFVFLNGTPPRESRAWRLEAIKKINQIDRIRNGDQVSCSTLDYRESIKELARVYEERSESSRIIVCPTGSKMQTTAVGIFRSLMDDVQIVYPTPLKYASPRGVSKGVQARYRLGLGWLSAFQ